VDLRTDDQLLVAASRDPEAFAVFYRRHVDAVLLYARCRLVDIETAADLTADVFTAAFAARARYRVTAEPARAWLFGIANNLLASRARRERRAARARSRLAGSRLHLDDAELERAEAEIDARLKGSKARALMDDLPVEQRTAVLARVVLEQDYADIARSQCSNEATIRQRVHRGLTRLAAGMREERP
jgi:RNA polymerase sigma factor (sigma-70 family)